MPFNSPKYVFELQMKVRDYEVDCEGIVNNANYLHYFEHTRHEFCEQAGLSFRKMHLSGIDPVLSKATIEYKLPLGLAEPFVSKLALGKRGPVFIFYQDIYKADGRLAVSGKIEVVCIENGKLTRGAPLFEAFKDYIVEE